ncbi:unnamed protein product [Hydatigera taeniaeformis]|uniref:Uncharacterized protein n=1 Tax=Hydatigena taeniaeformis TaxID=6205 RepID=A0A0R3WPV3_HYDTA|nr:unnamed protein product [Hydatigera taeniaeformis]
MGEGGLDSHCIITFILGTLSILTTTSKGESSSNLPSNPASTSNLGSGQRRAKSLVPLSENSDWWKVVDNGEEEAGSSPGPLIPDPGYVNGVDSALIPLLDGLVHNISCSWFFDNPPEPRLETQSTADPLTAPGLLLEFDFDILD